MRRVSLLAAAALFALTACDGQVTAPDSKVGPEGPMLSTDSEGSYLVTTGAHDETDFRFFTTLRSNSEDGVFQFVAGRFDLDEPAQIDGIEFFAWVFASGSLDVVIRADEDGVPGDVVASRSFEVEANGGSGWLVLEGYDASVPAGAYWLSFEPEAGAGLSAGLQSGAESPLDDYALYHDTSDGWEPTGSALGSGMRISGSVLDDPPEEDVEEGVGPIDVPEELIELPATIATVDMNRGARNSLEALVRNSIRKLEAGELEPGCGMLNALLSQLQAQSGRQVPEETAQDLIGQVESIRSQIGC